MKEESDKRSFFPVISESGSDIATLPLYTNGIPKSSKKEFGIRNSEFSSQRLDDGKSRVLAERAFGNEPRAAEVPL